VNGRRVKDGSARRARPNQTLLNFLRTEMLLTGSKLGCAEGGCGACTVLVSRADRADPSKEKVLHYTVNACLMPVLAADGCHITTVEGVGSVRAASEQSGNNGGGLHPVQQAMVDMHGSQCGAYTKTYHGERDAAVALHSTPLGVRFGSFR
jgi:xanthine dehydrogenase/oxidase